MSTDQELFAEVRAVLHEEVADVTAGPALLAGVRRRHTRGMFTRRLVLVASVAAAVGVAVPLALPEQEAVEPENASYVMARTSAALDDALDDVVYERAVVSGSEYYLEPGQEAVYELWHAADGSSFRMLQTVDGKPFRDQSFDRESDVIVEYKTRTYIARPGFVGSPAPLDDVWTPAEIQQAIKEGRITVVGPDQVNGKPTIKLYRVPRKADVPMDLWVDATTYLPVRYHLRQEGPMTFDVSWLPPTPENLAKLKTVIPPGFTEQK
jgi:hypothetical protein